MNEYNLIQEVYDETMSMLRDRNLSKNRALEVLELAKIYSLTMPMGIASFRDRVLSRRKALTDYIEEKR